MVVAISRVVFTGRYLLDFGLFWGMGGGLPAWGALCRLGVPYVLVAWWLVCGGLVLCMLVSCVLGAVGFSVWGGSAPGALSSFVG